MSVPGKALLGLAQMPTTRGGQAYLQNDRVRASVTHGAGNVVWRLKVEPDQILRLSAVMGEWMPPRGMSQISFQLWGLFSVRLGVQKRI